MILSPQTSPIKARRNRYRVKVKEIIESIKASEPCKFCGEMDPVVKQFHHKNPEEKLFDVGNSWRSYGMAVVAAEVAKCIVVCANCHLRIHAGKIVVEE